MVKKNITNWPALGIEAASFFTFIKKEERRNNPIGLRYYHRKSEIAFGMR